MLRAVRRHHVLPARGVLIASTDVHGNDEDMERLEEIFLDERDVEPETHWVILGDIVHAPSDLARADRPDLYDFPDGSMGIIDRLRRLEREHSGHVHFVLGNHDHAHVGGPRTRKFFPDEVAALERTLSPEEKARLRHFFEKALLAVAAPCGVLMTHGAPDEGLVDLRALDGTPLDIQAMSEPQRQATRALLTSYGQPDYVARRMLSNVSSALGFELGVILHGHDRDESGVFREGEHQVCPCIFGAPRLDKRYVRLDLGSRYDSASSLRDGVEILRLWA